MRSRGSTYAPALPASADSPSGSAGRRRWARTLFARDAARWLRARGGAAVAVDLEAYLRQDVPVGSTLPEEFYDLDRLDRSLFEPHARGEEVSLPPGAAVDSPFGDLLPRDADLLLAGPCLLEARLRSRLERVVHLEVEEAVRRRRELVPALARERGAEGAEGADGDLARCLRTHRERHDPEQLADLVLEASNPLGAGARDLAPRRGLPTRPSGTPGSTGCPACDRWGARTRSQAPAARPRPVG